MNRRRPIDFLLPRAVGPRRDRRVIVLLAGIVLLSIADLVMTLQHLQTIGMVEANPIAAFLIRETNSPWVLSAYKALTVLICISLLYRLRRHRSGEVAAWCAVAILACLSVMWHFYSQEVDSPVKLQVVQIQGGDEWLRLD